MGKYTYEEGLEKVSHFGLTLSEMPEFCNDFKLVKKAVENDGLSLEYASEELKNNFDIVMAAVCQDGYAIEYASEELKKNKNIILAALNQNGLVSSYIGKDWLENLFSNEYNEVIKKTMIDNPCIYKWVSKEIKEDYEVTKNAVLSFGSLLEYAPEEFKNNFDIVMTAVCQDGSAIEYASEELKKNKNIILAAINNKYPKAMCYISKDKESYRKFALEALSLSLNSIKYIEKSYLDDEEFVLEVIGKQGDLYDYISNKLKSNPDIFYKAISEGGYDYYQIEDAPLSIRLNKKIWLYILGQLDDPYHDTGYIIESIPDKLLCDYTFVKDAVAINGFIIDYVSSDLKNDKELMKIACEKGNYWNEFE